MIHSSPLSFIIADYSPLISEAAEQQIYRGQVGGGGEGGGYRHTAVPVATRPYYQGGILPHPPFPPPPLLSPATYMGVQFK